MAQITPTYKELKRDLIRIQLANGNPNEIADAIIARFWKNTNAIKNEQQNKPPLTYQIGKEPLLIVANKQLKKEQTQYQEEIMSLEQKNEKLQNLVSYYEHREQQMKRSIATITELFSSNIYNFESAIDENTVTTGSTATTLDLGIFLTKSLELAESRKNLTFNGNELESADKELFLEFLNLGYSNLNLLSKPSE